MVAFCAVCFGGPLRSLFILQAIIPNIVRQRAVSLFDIASGLCIAMNVYIKNSFEDTDG